jgi:hypothetical protein
MKEFVENFKEYADIVNSVTPKSGRLIQNKYKLQNIKIKEKIIEHYGDDKIVCINFLKKEDADRYVTKKNMKETEAKNKLKCLRNVFYLKDGDTKNIINKLTEGRLYVNIVFI